MSPDSEEITNIKPSRDRFIDDVRPRLMPDNLASLPVSRALALWLAADGLVETDEDGRVIAWNDIRAGDNQSDEIAWQPDADHRPLWVDSVIGGRPAIRFSRDYDHLVTTPLATTSNQTVFLVFAQRAQGDPGYTNARQLLSYNGPPTRALEDLSDPGVLQIDDSLAPGRFYGKVYMVVKSSQVGPNPFSTGFSVGEASARESLPVDQPAVLTYVYAHRDNYSGLYLDGELQGTSTAQFDIAVNSRKVIGKHGKPSFKSFQGDIAEVVIFNDRLSDEEIGRMNRHLRDKYGL